MEVRAWWEGTQRQCHAAGSARRVVDDHWKLHLGPGERAPETLFPCKQRAMRQLGHEIGWFGRTEPSQAIPGRLRACRRLGHPRIREIALAHSPPIRSSIAKSWFELMPRFLAI